MQVGVRLDDVIRYDRHPHKEGVDAVWKLVPGAVSRYVCLGWVRSHDDGTFTGEVALAFPNRVHGLGRRIDGVFDSFEAVVAAMES